MYTRHETELTAENYEGYL